MNELGATSTSAPAARLRTALARSHLRSGLLGVAGAVAGAAYAHFVGCRTGTCPITSSVWTASLYGGVVGALVGLPDRRRGRSHAGGSRGAAEP